PVFTVPYELPFIAVTEVAMTRLVDAQSAQLRRTLDVHRALVELVLAEQGLDAILAEAARHCGCTLRLREPHGETLAEAGRWRPAPDASQVVEGDVGGPGRPDAVLDAYRPDGWSDDAGLVLLGHVRTVLAVELLKRRAVREAERRAAGDLL